LNVSSSRVARLSGLMMMAGNSASALPMPDQSIPRPVVHVRYHPGSGAKADMTGGPGRATSGHSRTAAAANAILATIDSINRRRGTIPHHEANNGRRVHHHYSGTDE
jgi:hypothetical protein